MQMYSYLYMSDTNLTVLIDVHGEIVLPPIKFKRKVFESGDSFRVVIPVEIIKALELRNGDDLEIWLNDHQIVMQKTK
jgi:hypothetical protein